MSEHPKEPSNYDRGDTLLEILIALAIIGLTATALLTAFATAITSSRIHRDIATNDQVLRSVTETAFSQIQQQSSPKYVSCAGASTYQPYLQPSSALPSGSPLSTLYSTYTVTVNSVEYWNSSTNSFVTTCASGSTSPQLITMTVSAPNGATKQFQFTVASQGSLSSVTVKSTTPTSANVGTTTSVAISGSGFESGATATFSCSSATFTPSTSSVNSGGTVLSASLIIPSNATPSTCTITVVNPDGTTATSGVIFTIVGPVAKFQVNVPSTAFDAMPFSVTLTAVDAANNPVTTYSGNKTVVWACKFASGSCSSPALPTGSITFVNGVSTTSLSATLNDVGTDTLTATDNGSSPSIVGSSSVTLSKPQLSWINYQNSSSKCTLGTNTTTALIYTGCLKISFTFSGSVELVSATGTPVVNTGSPITLSVTGVTGVTSLTIASGSSMSSSAVTSTFQFTNQTTSAKITVAQSSFGSISATFSR